jgi:drug/metabolite transporter (DMT)-like permease
MNNEPKPIWLAYLALVTAMLIWGSSFSALKVAMRAYDPMVVIFGRMAVGSFCFLFFFKRFRGVSVRKKDIKYLLFMAFCEPCLYFIFEAHAVTYTAASQAGIITSMLPLMVAVSAYFFLKEQVNKKTLLGFALAIGGACWLSLASESTENAPNPALGNFLEFVAMVCATGYVVTLKHLTTSLSPFFLTMVQAVVGCAFYLPILFLPFTQIPQRLDFTSSLAVLYLGSIVTIGAYGLYNYGVSRIPVSQASAFVNLIPVFAILIGWVVLDETLTMAQYLAVLLIFGGVYVSQRTK